MNPFRLGGCLDVTLMLACALVIMGMVYGMVWLVIMAAAWMIGEDVWLQSRRGK